MFNNIYFFNFFGGRSYEKVIKTYISASIEDPDAYELITLIPDEILDEAVKDSDVGRRENIENLQDSLEQSAKYLYNRCDELSVSFEIADVDDSSKNEIKLLSDDCEDLFGFTVSDEKEITVELSINMVIDGEEDTETRDVKFTVIKVNGDWYLWEIDGRSLKEGIF